MSRQGPPPVPNAQPQLATAAAVNPSGAPSGMQSNPPTGQPMGAGGSLPPGAPSGPPSGLPSQANSNVFAQNTATRQIGDQVYSGMDKMNPELFSVFYGTFVMQLIHDHQNVEVVNVELYKIGYNMGVRMVEEFFAKTGVESCQTFFDTITTIANIALKVFLGVDAEVVSPGASTTGASSGATGGGGALQQDGRVYNIVLKSNPLTDFVDTLPQGMEGLCYSNAICGAITGALRMLSLVVECQFVQEKLKGGAQDELCVQLVEVVNEGYVDDEV